MRVQPASQLVCFADLRLYSTDLRLGLLISDRADRLALLISDRLGLLIFFRTLPFFGLSFGFGSLFDFGLLPMCLLHSHVTMRIGLQQMARPTLPGVRRLV